MPGIWSRRALLIGGVGTAVLAAAGLRLRSYGDFAFEPLKDPAGFRWLDSKGSQVSVVNPLIGFDSPDGLVDPVPVGEDGFCDTLFARTTPGAVPVAAFSDYFCPLCRELSDWLIALEQKGRILITWHELPRLGPSSVAAARAAVAADLQGRYPALHARLIRTRFDPNAAYLSSIAGSAGLDVPRFMADLRSPEVTRRLGQSATLAQRFGFPGTPALVVGRTATLGMIPRRRLEALIALEAREGSVTGVCA